MKRLIILFFPLILFPFRLRAQNDTLHYEINVKDTLQIIDGFGASDAWTMQHIGLWPDDVRRQAADWLFSTVADSTGRPAGIGLSVWRFNIGAGSAAQRNASGISSPDMRTECFLNSDGTYDWSRQVPQRVFMQMAKERGVSTFIGFFNSPPVYFTQNGLATNTGRDGTLNLRPDCYDDFADFAANVVEGLMQDGITLSYVCPVNEPDGHWNWIGPKQEGSPATNREIARLAKEFSRAFTEKNLNTKILLNESSDYRCVFGTYKTDWQRGNAVQAFFRSDSTATFLGTTPLVPRLLAAHSYWTDTPVSSLRNYRTQLHDSLAKYGIDFWQTEVCIMSNDVEIGGGNRFDRTMRTALYVARIIHHDLVFAHARSWQWWRAVGGDYKDGLLREYANDGTGSRLVDSKLLWAFGNYSLFIRPGAHRMGVNVYDKKGSLLPDGDTDPYGLMMSAYRNTDGTWVAVLINYAPVEKTFSLHVNDATVGVWHRSLTSDDDGVNLLPLECVPNGSVTTIPPRSILTFVSSDK